MKNYWLERRHHRISARIAKNKAELRADFPDGTMIRVRSLPQLVGRVIGVNETGLLLRVGHGWYFRYYSRGEVIKL